MLSGETEEVGVTVAGVSVEFEKKQEEEERKKEYTERKVTGEVSEGIQDHGALIQDHGSYIHFQSVESVWASSESKNPMTMRKQILNEQVTKLSL
jgi:hypothetical protein